MKNIPLHKTSERFNGSFAFVRKAGYAVGDVAHPVYYTHRDDYYIFLFLQEGNVSFMLDFEEVAMSSNTIRVILPGQVHTFGEIGKVKGWMLAVDSMVIKEEHKDIFNRASFVKSQILIDSSTSDDLGACIELIEKRLSSPKESDIDIASSLLNSFVSIFAQSYSSNICPVQNNRASELTLQFQSLLRTHYATLKSPSQYADLMHITPVYLNEVVKKTTGQTVINAIQTEVITQAKRMLYYSNNSIKEIAYELGYDDWSYFTRIFSKYTKYTPTQFRLKNRK